MSLLPRYFSEPQRILLRAGMAIFLLIGGVQALYGPSLPSVRAAFGVSTAAAGWVVGVHALGAVVGVLVSLYLETRQRPRTRLVMGMGLIGCGSLGFAAIHAWPWALLGVLGIGLGYGLLVVGINAQFAVGFAGRSAALLILVNAGFGLGAVVGPLLFGLFSSGNFRPPFLVAGALALLLIPLGWAVRDTTGHMSRPPAPAGRGSALVLGAFVTLFLLYTALESDTSSWMATHLIFHGYPRSTAAALTAGFWLALTIGRLLSVPISLRLTPRRMVGGSLIGVTVLAGSSHFAAVMPAAYILTGLLLAPIFPVGLAWMERALPGRPGTTSMALLGALGGALIFPVVVGRVIGANTPDVLPLALVALAVSCLLVSVSLPRLIDAEGAQPPSTGTAEGMSPRLRQSRRGLPEHDLRG